MAFYLRQLIPERPVSVVETLEPVIQLTIPVGIADTLTASGPSMGRTDETTMAPKSVGNAGSSEDAERIEVVSSQQFSGTGKDSSYGRFCAVSKLSVIILQTRRRRLAKLPRADV